MRAFDRVFFVAMVVVIAVVFSSGCYKVQRDGLEVTSIGPIPQDVFEPSKVETETYYPDELEKGKKEKADGPQTHEFDVAMPNGKKGKGSVTVLNIPVNNEKAETSEVQPRTKKKETRVYYSEGLEICRQLALRNPTAEFVYTEDGGCRVNGSPVPDKMQAIWENWTDWTIRVDIFFDDSNNTVPDRSMTLAPYTANPLGNQNLPYTRFALIQEEAFSYNVWQLDANGRAVRRLDSKSHIQVNEYTEDSFSQMTGEWVDAVFSTRPN